MVRMAKGLTFGTSIVDWQERINVERMRRERADKARAVLRARGIPCTRRWLAHFLDRWGVRPIPKRG